MGLPQVIDAEVAKQISRRSYLAKINPDKYVLLPKLVGKDIGILVWEVGLPGPFEESTGTERNIMCLYLIGPIIFTDQYRETGEHFVAGLNRSLKRRKWHFWR